MAIITISRGTFSGGEQLATIAGEMLGYRVIGREGLFKRVADTYGIKREALEDLWDPEPPLVGAAVTEHQRMMVAVQASLCDLLGEDRVVYHGQVAHLLLPGVSHTLKVRLVAPRAMRVKAVMEHEHLTELEAHHYIDHVDGVRARWARVFYGADWTDPALYDMVLNLEWMKVTDAAEILAAATRLPVFQPTEESRAKLANIRLASRVRARLMTDTRTSDFFLDVRAESGRVRVSGIATREHIDLVTDVVRGVPGVEQVETLPSLTAR
jgi:cytidylate kinase